MVKGVKADKSKPRFGLIPPHMLEEVARVLTFGAEKYAKDNWKYVEDGRERYLDALLRHALAYNKGEVEDPESGMHHLAHAICCALFIGEADLQGTELGPNYDKIRKELNEIIKRNSSRS